jgi:hypothetical protein
MESVDSNFTVTGGVRFETIVPQRELIIPNQGSINSVEFSIKVTNQTSTPYRFMFFNLFPELMGSEGYAMELYYAKKKTGGLKAPSAESYFLAKPGEGWIYKMKASLFYRRDQLALGGWDLSNASWCFVGLRAARYGIGFTYKNLFPTGKINNGSTPWPFSEERWTGIASVPYREFYLKHPPS